jgi:two-component system chemotaxis response regulator CheB
VSSPLNILIVDDSATYRMILKRLVEQYGARVAGMVADGSEAVEAVRSKNPDVVLLDMMMPGMDGIQVLQKLQSEKLNVDVIMVSGVNEDQAQLTMRALQHGALDFVRKPQSFSSSDSLSQLKEELHPLLDVVRQKDRDHKPLAQRAKPAAAAPAPPKPAPPKPSAPPAAVDAVVIAVSTGGPVALRQVIPRLPADLQVPVYIVQHMPALFTKTLATQLDMSSALRVHEAEQGMEPKPGHVYVAPGGRHMVVRGTIGRPRIEIEDTPPVNNCKPAADVLFRSTLLVYRNRQLCLVLTGMGNDGTAGVRELRGAGAYCIVQDQASSVVWGMPGSVVRAGLADEVVPLPEISSRVVSIVRGVRK